MIATHPFPRLLAQYFPEESHSSHRCLCPRRETGPELVDKLHLKLRAARRCQISLVGVISIACRTVSLSMRCQRFAASARMKINSCHIIGRICEE